MGVELAGRERERRVAAAGQVAEADDRELRRLGERLEVVGLGAAPGEVRREVVVGLDEPAEAVGAEVLPGHPELERAPAARALEAELVEVELVAVVVVLVVRRPARSRGRAARGVSPPR